MAYNSNKNVQAGDESRDQVFLRVSTVFLYCEDGELLSLGKETVLTEWLQLDTIIGMLLMSFHFLFTGVLFRPILRILVDINFIIIIHSWYMGSVIWCRGLCRISPGWANNTVGCYCFLWTAGSKNWIVAINEHALHEGSFISISWSICLDLY